MLLEHLPKHTLTGEVDRVEHPALGLLREVMQHDREWEPAEQEQKKDSLQPTSQSQGQGQESRAPQEDAAELRDFACRLQHLLQEGTSRTDIRLPLEDHAADREFDRLLRSHTVIGTECVPLEEQEQPRGRTKA